MSKLQFPNIKLTIFHSFIVLSLCISVQRSLINFHHCSEFKVEHIFADNAQVKSWNVFGLPDNRFAIESAVILQLSGLIRWKIFINEKLLFECLRIIFGIQSRIRRRAKT